MTFQNRNTFPVKKRREPKRVLAFLVATILFMVIVVPVCAINVGDILPVENDIVTSTESSELTESEKATSTEESMPSESGTSTESDIPAASTDSSPTESGIPASSDENSLPDTSSDRMSQLDEGVESEPTEDTTEQVSVTGKIVTEGDQPGLYITMENVPSSTDHIRVEYSFGGLDYEESYGKMWLDSECRPDESGKLTLKCYDVDEHPLSAYLSEAVNSLYIKVYYFEGWENYGELEPIGFSHEKTYPTPETPPPFSAKFQLGWYSYEIIGHFADFMPNIARVFTTYSWDGINYQYINPDWPNTLQYSLAFLGSSNAQEQGRLENQEVALSFYEPLSSFLAYKQNSFYIRLEITTDSNEVYYSQPAYFSRDKTQLLPENLTPRVALAFDVAVEEARNDNGNSPDDDDYYAELEKYTYGQIQLTVRENATWEEIKTYLPDTVPIRVTFWDKNKKEKYASGTLDCKVTWKTPPDFSLTPGEPLVIENMAEPLVVPAGTEVKTALGTYKLRKPLTFQSRYNSDDIRLVLNPITAEENPDIALRINQDLIDQEGNYLDTTALSLAFWKKPSGAVSIKTYINAAGVRTEICDLLDRRSVDHNLSHMLYGYIDLLKEDEYPYREYVSGDLDHLTIEVHIKGGVFDGKQVTLPWPEEYDAPEVIPDPSGFEGQENNAGSYEEIEEEDGDGDNSNGGLHPGIPDADKPPVVVLPPANLEDYGSGGSTFSPKVPQNEKPQEETTSSEQASDSNMETASDIATVAPTENPPTSEPEETTSSPELSGGVSTESSVPEEKPAVQEKVENTTDPLSSDNHLSEENFIEKEPDSQELAVTAPPQSESLVPKAETQKIKISKGIVAGILVLGIVVTILIAGNVSGTLAMISMIGKRIVHFKDTIFHR